MKEITIDFFPAVGTANLWFGDYLVDSETNPVANQLKTSVIDEWLYPYRRGYHVWRGLPMELMDEVDDDELVITIMAPRTVYEQIEQAFAAQMYETDDMGFRHNAYKLLHKRVREIEDCKNCIARIYEQCSVFLDIADQENLMIETAYKKMLDEAESFSDIYEASKLLVKLLNRQIENCEENESYASVLKNYQDQVRETIWGE